MPKCSKSSKSGSHKLIAQTIDELVDSYKLHEIGRAIVYSIKDFKKEYTLSSFLSLFSRYNTRSYSSLLNGTKHNFIKKLRESLDDYINVASAANLDNSSLVDSFISYKGAKIKDETSKLNSIEGYISHIFENSSKIDNELFSKIALSFKKGSENYHNDPKIKKQGVRSYYRLEYDYVLNALKDTFKDLK